MAEGTLIEERNFATLDFSGPLQDRRLRIQVFDVDGVNRHRFLGTLRGYRDASTTEPLERSLASSSIAASRLFW